MPRYAAVIDQARTQGTAKLAGASVAVYLPNTTNSIPGTLDAGPIGPATLSNPFTTSTGVFFLVGRSAASGRPGDTIRLDRRRDDQRREMRCDHASAQHADCLWRAGHHLVSELAACAWTMTLVSARSISS